MADASSLYAAHYRGFFPGWTAFERSWAGLDSAALARVAKELADRKVTLVPTLVLHETFSRLDDPAVLGDTMLQAVPELEQARWNVPDMVRRAGWTDQDYPAFRAGRPKQDLFLRLFAAAGGRIATGTDASNQLLIPGYSEHRELELLVGGGVLAAGRPAGGDPERRTAPRRGLARHPRARARRPTSSSSPATRSTTSATPSRSTASCRAACCSPPTRSGRPGRRVAFGRILLAWAVVGGVARGLGVRRAPGDRRRAARPRRSWPAGGRGAAAGAVRGALVREPGIGRLVARVPPRSAG